MALISQSGLLMTCFTSALTFSIFYPYNELEKRMNRWFDASKSNWKRRWKMETLTHPISIRLAHPRKFYKEYIIAYVINWFLIVYYIFISSIDHLVQCLWYNSSDLFSATNSDSSLQMDYKYKDVAEWAWVGYTVFLSFNLRKYLRTFEHIRITSLYSEDSYSSQNSYSVDPTAALRVSNFFASCLLYTFFLCHFSTLVEKKYSKPIN